MPAPARRAASAARRAAPVMAAPPTTVTCPRVYLWASAVRAGSRHRVGRLAKARGAIPSSTRVWDADIGQFDPSAQVAARQQQVARFQPEEGDRQFGCRGIAQRQSGRSVEARGNVDRDNAPGSFQGVGDQTVHRPGQPGAEHRIDPLRRSDGLRRAKTQPSGRTRGARHRRRRNPPAAGQARPDALANHPEPAGARRRSRHRRCCPGRPARAPGSALT